jgi:hypothetical protein
VNDGLPETSNGQVLACMFKMKTQGLTDSAAYRLLRETAMRQRTTIEEVSARIEADGTCGIVALAKS